MSSRKSSALSVWQHSRLSWSSLQGLCRLAEISVCQWPLSQLTHGIGGISLSLHRSVRRHCHFCAGLWKKRAGEMIKDECWEKMRRCALITALWLASCILGGLDLKVSLMYNSYLYPNQKRDPIFKFWLWDGSVRNAEAPPTSTMLELQEAAQPCLRCCAAHEHHSLGVICISLLHFSLHHMICVFIQTVVCRCWHHITVDASWQWNSLHAATRWCWRNRQILMWLLIYGAFLNHMRALL